LASIAGVLLMVAICTVFAVVARTPSMPAAAADPRAPELPSEPPPPSAGVTQVTWALGGGVYNGVIHTNGPTGHVDIHTVEPGVGPVVIREDLELQRGARGWTYVASNPRYAGDNKPANFIPNVFYLEQGASGAWTFVETCAIGTGMCARMKARS
jgi:hypothetical protein